VLEFQQSTLSPSGSRWTGSGGSYELGASSAGLGLLSPSSTEKVRIGHASCTLTLRANVLALALCSTRNGGRLPSGITASIGHVLVARTGSHEWQCSPQGPLSVPGDNFDVIACAPRDLGTVLVLQRSKTSQG